MNRARVLTKHICAAVVLVLASLPVIGLTRAEDATSQPAPSGQAPPAPDAEAMKQEVARIKRLLSQMVFRAGGYEDGILVKHFVGKFYVAKVGFRNHTWRHYLVNGNDATPIGLAEGERGLNGCVSALLQVYREHKLKIDPAAVVQKSVEALEGDYGVIVKANADIPGYDAKPLPADLAAIIRPMWTYTTKGIRGEETHYVIYTYHQIGGRVFRHDFTFGPHGRDVATMRLAIDIGKAKYYL